MKRTDWNGEIYTGSVLPPGFRVRIQASDATTGALNVCGNAMDSPVPDVDCPNCRRLLLRVFDLDMSDSSLAALAIWNGDRLVVRVCPSCSLYFEPFWVVPGEVPLVVGGNRDGGEILQDVCPPYPPRPIQLTPLTEDDYPTTEERVDALAARRRDDGVLHQVGGLPFLWGYAEMNCCQCDKLMRFAGVVDYDNLNVPLYEDEDRRPVALIIGDHGCLNLFTCVTCSVVGLRLAQIGS